MLAKRPADTARKTRPIDATTGITAIFGDPVAHSGSPAMHNAAYAALGMNRVYVAYRVPSHRLPAALEAIEALGMIGANITVPHKEPTARAIKFRRHAELSAEAYALAAVNCVVNRRGILYADNTDARGLEADLLKLQCDPGGKAAIVIGAGGAGAAAALALFRLGAAKIVICNRTVPRAAALARRINSIAQRKIKIEARGLDALADTKLVADAGAIVNASAMGMATRRFAPVAYDAAPPECMFYDLIYSARPTPFLKPAIAKGRRVSDGAGMLVEQGELAFKLFNGVAPPRGVMRAALMTHLGRSPLS
ncbi:MAG TPA: shikimate dehydrogenase, partial [Candidatus Binataceae bacterium]|nr:shikimate dehydrogenase [Candidatus Binataceae bacterium]